MPAEQQALRRQIADVVAELSATAENLREISRGLHPAVLSEGGLRPALNALARRSALPVVLDVQVGSRFPQQVEVAAYYAVAEALTNASKHAHASEVSVRVTAGDGELRLLISDDGIGGASIGGGSGLIGLKDRVEALGGRLELSSPVGGGTTLRAVIPCA
jgi:signal transduction histidine kinase